MWRSVWGAGVFGWWPVAQISVADMSDHIPFLHLHARIMITSFPISVLGNKVQTEQATMGILRTWADTDIAMYSQNSRNSFIVNGGPIEARSWLVTVVKTTLENFLQMSLWLATYIWERTVQRGHISNLVIASLILSQKIVSTAAHDKVKTNTRIVYIYNTYFINIKWS